MHENEPNPRFTAIAGRGGSAVTEGVAGPLEFPRDHERPSLAVVEAVTAETERDPLDLDPLYTQIDPDALDTLVASATDNVRIGFTYEGCDVVVEGSGDISVTPATED